MYQTFRVGLTRDFLSPDGSIGFGDIGLDVLESAEGINWEFLPHRESILSPDNIAGYDGLLVLGTRVAAQTLADVEQLMIVARFGVGYDNIDVPACTEQGVILTITPDGVRRPVAVSVITYVLALSHKLLIKDRLVRDGRWLDKLDYMGSGVTGKTLGVIGLGNIGREILSLAQPFDMRLLASDPYGSTEQASAVGAELVDLETLLHQSDFVSISCALTEETHHLINAERLALMKESAYLINTARGPIVDEQALIQVLQQGKIRGAGLDVFEQEPVASTNPLLSMENVIVTPHAICWTDECFLGNGRSACQSIVDVARGRIPENVVNRQAVDHPRFQRRRRQLAD